ncbi:MAG: Mobile element protein [uncultured Caballeronia sp.]|nr:MAG: Mobile element protein [uncultured Caballeronia sp.]
MLDQLLVSDDALSQLAGAETGRQGFRLASDGPRTREARHTLQPLYEIAKTLPPRLGLKQNVLYYASLANFYTVHDLRNLKADQTQLYLLCYA